MTALVIVGAASACAGLRWAIAPVLCAFKIGLAVGRIKARQQQAAKPTREWNT